MSATVEVELSCDGPNHPKMPMFGCMSKTGPLLADSAKEARREARLSGWIQSRRNGKLVDICKPCQEIKVGT